LFSGDGGGSVEVPCACAVAAVSIARITAAGRAALCRRAALKLQIDAAGWEDRMLETIAIILIVLWLLGMVSGYTLGNFIYVLLVIAIVLFLVRLVSGRRVV
jgi:uncharacterized protein DUF5670